MVFNMSEKEIEEAIKRWSEEQERLRWKNDDRHNSFLGYIEELVKVYKQIDSESSYFTDDKIKNNYSYEEFSNLLFSLFELIGDYAKEINFDNNLEKEEDYEFISREYPVRIYNNYYLISLIMGQGSLVKLELLNKEDVDKYIDYNNIPIS